jgi:hypothetical protein
MRLHTLRTEAFRHFARNSIGALSIDTMLAHVHSLSECATYCLHTEYLSTLERNNWRIGAFSILSNNLLLHLAPKQANRRNMSNRSSVRGGVNVQQQQLDVNAERTAIICAALKSLYTKYVLPLEKKYQYDYFFESPFLSDVEFDGKSKFMAKARIIADAKILVPFEMES